LGDYFIFFFFFFVVVVVIVVLTGMRVRGKVRGKGGERKGSRGG
jgi:hypothetical protein